MRTAPVRLRRGEVHEYCLLDDRPSLVWAANLSAIELHPFLADHHDPDRPLALVLDLDPGRLAGLAEACRVALLVRQGLEAEGLASFPKASGSRGIHVHVPLNTPVTFEETKSFARALAGRLAREYPEQAVDRIEQRAREGRVLVDWGQNDARRSIVAPYSLRARRRPVVAAPLSWREVERGIDRPGSVELGPEELLDRLDRDGDPFASVLTLRQRL
jgi:bifunctional non-homologous end joining protein LigD